MELRKKIELAQAIQELIEKNLIGIWQGFEPVPFILYDDKHQVAVGNDWPERYIKVSENLFVAEGVDQNLMGNTALKYDNRMIAIWDTRTWPDDVNAVKAATGVAHEMFHAYQTTDLKLEWANELLFPQYEHSGLSVALVIEENICLENIVSNYNDISVRENLEKIAGLRKNREKEIGKDYMNYDMNVESIEGTAAYVEIKMNAVLTGQTIGQSVSKYLKKINETQKLLNDYRHRCYASGLILCLAADLLHTKWQDEWSKTGVPLFTWLKDTFALEHRESQPRETSLQEGKMLLENFAAEKKAKIEEFVNKPLICMEGEIALLAFDPMNLVCDGKRCLHLHGMLRLKEREFYIQTPFLEEFDGTIMNAKRVWLTNEVTVKEGGFVISNLGEFEGTIKHYPDGWHCKL